MKKSYIEKQKERLGQKIKLLISRPDFQEEILTLRKKWNIPVKGIKNEEDNQAWHEQLYIATDKFHEEEWPKYRRELKKLRDDKKFIEEEKKRREVNLRVPLNAFGNDVWNIVKKFKLAPRWQNGIKRYLLFNDSEHLNLFSGIIINTSWEKGIEKISLEIDSDTTLSDVKRIWPWIKRMQRGLSYKLSDKYQPIKKFERDKRAYELEKKGKTIEEIGEAINLEFDNSLGDSEIRQIIKRYKKRLNIN